MIDKSKALVNEETGDSIESIKMTDKEKSNIERLALQTENKLREGGLGYGDLKKTLFEHYWNYFEKARAQRAELENNLDHVNQVLKESAQKARALATTVLDRAKKNCGLS